MTLTYIKNVIELSAKNDKMIKYPGNFSTNRNKHVKPSNRKNTSQSITPDRKFEYPSTLTKLEL